MRVWGTQIILCNCRGAILSVQLFNVLLLFCLRLLSLWPRSFFSKATSSNKNWKQHRWQWWTDARRMNYHRCKWGSLTLFVYLYTRSVGLVAIIKEHDYVISFFLFFFWFTMHIKKRLKNTFTRDDRTKRTHKLT